jgi:hypothetical protein
MGIMCSLSWAVHQLGPSAVGPLDAPEVRRLQREALRQVAALADPPRVDPGGGAATAAAASPRVQLQPSWSLLRPQVDPRAQRMTHMDAVCNCVSSVLCLFGILKTVGCAATFSRLAERLFPSRAEAAALGAGIMRSLHRCMVLEMGEQEPSAAAGPTESDRQGGAPCEDTSLTRVECRAQLALSASRASYTLVEVVMARMRDGPDATAAAVLPSLLEMAARLAGMHAAWLSRTAGGRLAADDAECFDNGACSAASLPASLLSGVAFEPSEQGKLGEIQEKPSGLAGGGCA